MPVVSRNDGFPITLKIPAQRLSRRFHTEEEVLEWIRAETSFWEQMNQFSHGHNFPRPDDNLGFLNAMTVGILRQASAYGEPAARLDFIEGSGIMLSEGKQAKFLSKLKADEPELYPGAFAALASTLIPLSEQFLAAQGNRHPLPWSLWMSGLGGLLRYVENDRSSVLDREEIERLGSRAREILEELQTKSREMADLHDTQKVSLERLGQVNGDAFDKTLAGFGVLFQEQLDRSGASLADFEKMVRDRLALEAPTKFWTDKARSHRNVAIGFGILFLVAIGGGVFWITHYGVSLVAEADKTIVGDRVNPGLLALVPLAFITLPTLGFAWTLRHISRIVVQNLALQADAQLRGTIANTYTALTSQNQSTPAELAIALNALFRPIDGSGHAEIAPPNIRDILEAGK